MTENTTALTCYIPKNLIIEKLPEYNPRWHDKYVWLVHSIVFKSLIQKDSFGGYVNLNGEMLQKYLGSNYAKKVIDQLIHAKVIEYNKAYSVGSFSKSYRLAKRYANKGIKGTQLKKQTYKRKILTFQSEYVKDVLKQSKHTRAEFLKLTYCRINVNEALEYIGCKYKQNSNEYKARYITIMQYNEMHKTDFSKGEYKINFTFKVNKRRIYSPVTMLARDLEQFTYFEGYEDQQSINIDMKNSQLCFYNLLTTGDIDVLNNIGENTIDDSSMNNMNNNNSNISVPTPLSFPTNPSPYVIHFSTPPKWSEIISAGKGYEYMMRLYNWKQKTEGHTPEERQEFKAEFFGQLFYNKYSDRLTDLEIVFMEHFEAEAKRLREYKKHYGNKLLAIKVQALEAHFFHTVVVDHMERNHIHVPYCIKHDSISMPISEADVIYPEINELAKKYFSNNNIELKWETK